MSIPMMGDPRDRVDGRAKVTGGARYAAENNLPGIVHAVVVPATIASGTISAIDASEAKKAPGVITVISHLNAPKLPAGPMGNFAEPHLIPFSDNQIHYVGQQIAVVVADTIEHATHGAELVKVKYQEKPARTDIAALRNEAKDKAAQQAPPLNKGDADGAFATAPVKIDQTYRTPYEHHHPMEAHATVVAFDGDHVTVHDSSQNIFAVRQMIARAFGIPRENVHVLSPFVGGAFGSKGSSWPHVIVAAVAAHEVKRPVKLWIPRKQLFFTNGHRPQTEQRVALGATQDGKLVSVIHEGISQSNAVCDYNERFTRPTREMYATPNMRVQNLVVELNVSSPTYMRAPGENPGMFALESAMDELAAALKMDPVQLRLINYADEDPSSGKPWSSKSLKECYSRAAERFGWSKRPLEARATRAGRWLIGQGMASATYPAHRSPASCRARMNADGTAILFCGSHEMGMGTATVMAQLAAATLGIPAERVRFEYGDTDLPQAPISAGSMTAASVGTAVFEASTALKKKIADMNNGADVADYAAFLHSKYLPSVEVQVDSKPDPEAEKYSTQAFGCHFAEVAVDPDLGIVRLQRMVSAFGGGRILNEKTAHSQLLGGIVMGIGMALLEQTHLDRRSGSYTNVNFGEYLVPVNADVHNIDVILVPEEDPHVNLIGAKGLGEIGIVGVAPSIANAVYHATGKRVRDLPITLDKLL